MSAFLKHAFVLCVGLIAFSVHADTLYVSGTVADSTGVLLPGAVVTARAGNLAGGRGGLGGGGGYTGGGTAVAGLHGTDTTDANGNFSIVIINDTFATVTVTATLSGYRSTGRGTIDTISAPKDGKADHVTANITMMPGGFTTVGTGDSLIVTGIVTDSSGAPVDSATVTVRTGRAGIGGVGGFGGGGRGVLTGTDGKYTVALRGDSSGLVTVSASTRNGRSGSSPATVAHPKDGVLDQITVNVVLGAIGGGTPGDSLYVSGIVKDSTGALIDSAVVSIRVGNGYAFSGGMHTIITGADGTYSLAVIGDTSGIFTVTATHGRITGEVQQKVATPKDGVADHVQSVNIQLGKRDLAVLQPQFRGTVANKQAFMNASAKVYSLDGRRIGSIRNGQFTGNGINGLFGCQMLIYRTQTENAAVAGKSIELK